MSSRDLVLVVDWLSGRVPDADSLSESVVPVHLPPGSRAGTVEESECWVSVDGVMMGEVTGGSVWTGDVTCICEGFFRRQMT